MNKRDAVTDDLPERFSTKDDFKQKESTQIVAIIG
jgi:hypothetical protein